jgi:type I restriction enzyme S subunit
MAQKRKMISESWGMSQPNISQTYLRNFLFPLPPFEEQNEIVENIKLAIIKNNLLENEILESQNLGKQLLQAVLKEAFEVKQEEIVIN